MSAAPARSAPPPPPQDEEASTGASARECRRERDTLQRGRLAYRGAVSVLIHLEERLLAAAKTDNESLLQSALEELKDINGVDG